MAVAATTSAKVDKLNGGNFVIVFVLITFLVVGISGLLAKTLFTSIVRDSKVASAKQAADKQLTADVAAAPKLVDAYQSMGSQATTLADALPTTADLPSLIVVLENMTSQAGVRLKSVSPNAAVVPADGTAPVASSTPVPQQYSFSLTFDGTYTTVQALLGGLEMSARPMHVTAMQLSGSGSALSGEIDITTYYQDVATLPFGTEVIK